MSSPNEPSEATAAGGAGNGSGSTAAEGTGSAPRSTPTSGPWLSDPSSRATESSQGPPWQRATGRAQQRPAGTPAPAGTSAGSSTSTAAPSTAAAAPTQNILDARASRYITGTAAPAAFQPAKSANPELDATVVRTEAARPAEYASEIPDLSGPLPRPTTQRRTETAGQPGSPAAAAAATAGRSASRIQVGRSKSGPVRASMQIRRIDPWSALKVSLLLSVALFFVWMIAVAFLYLVLGGMGVWSKLNSNVGDLLTANSGGGGELVSAESIFGGALLIGLVNIVLLTAMATIGAFVYNLSTDIVGGVEVTLADRD